MMNAEALTRLSAFVGVFGLMAAWEGFAPRRPLSTGKLRRWVANLGVVVLSTVLVRVLFSAGAVGGAAVATEQGGAC